MIKGTNNDLGGKNFMAAFQDGFAYYIPVILEEVMVKVVRPWSFKGLEGK